MRNKYVCCYALGCSKCGGSGDVLKHSFRVKNKRCPNYILYSDCPSLSLSLQAGVHPSLSQPGPIVQTATRSKLALPLLFPMSLGLVRKFVRGPVRRIQHPLGELRRQMQPHRAKLSNLRPNVPKPRQVRPSRAQFGFKLEPTSVSSAQVAPKLGPSRLVFNQLNPRTFKFEPSRLF